MYAIPAPRLPLPQVLDHAATGATLRRHHINDYLLVPREVEYFNSVLALLGRAAPPLQTDQLATAARMLNEDTADDAPSACIQQRIEHAQLLEQLLQDRDWEPNPQVSRELTLVVAYLHASRQLIPDTVPGVGQLDLAIVIDTVWPKLTAEVANFLDYRRLRHVEAQRQGRSDEEIDFNRSRWLELREIEARLHEHQRRVRESSYAPEPLTYFRVH